jgi:hypothetical protein
LTPKVVGEFEIQPKFVYFDIEKRKFVTLDTIIKINIRKGKNNLPTTAELDKMEAAAESNTKNIAIPEEEQIDFKAPQTKATFVANGSFKFMGSTFFWLLAVLQMLGVGLAVYLKQQKDKKDNISDTEVKRQQAGSQASKRLQNAKSSLSQGDAKTFYNEISKALLGFVADKFNIPTVDLTKNNVRQILGEQQIDAAKIDTLMNILQTCEMALFAGMHNKESMQKVYQDSEELIKIMEV